MNQTNIARNTKLAALETTITGLEERPLMKDAGVWRHGSTYCGSVLPQRATQHLYRAGDRVRDLRRVVQASQKNSPSSRSRCNAILAALWNDAGSGAFVALATVPTRTGHRRFCNGTASAVTQDEGAVPTTAFETGHLCRTAGIADNESATGRGDDQATA